MGDAFKCSVCRQDRAGDRVIRRVFHPPPGLSLDRPKDVLLAPMVEVPVCAQCLREWDDPAAVRSRDGLVETMSEIRAAVVAGYTVTVMVRGDAWLIIGYDEDCVLAASPLRGLAWVPWQCLEDWCPIALEPPSVAMPC